MTLLESILNEEIFIDFGQEYLFGSDQVFNTYPCRFATVTFQLLQTVILEEIIDRMRQDNMSSFVRDGWIAYSIGLNDYNDSKVDSCISAIVVNSSAPDNEHTYIIDLSEAEQRAMYKRLDFLCREYLAANCENLLEEARIALND